LGGVRKLSDVSDGDSKSEIVLTTGRDSISVAVGLIG